MNQDLKYTTVYQQGLDLQRSWASQRAWTSQSLVLVWNTPQSTNRVLTSNTVVYIYQYDQRVVVPNRIVVQWHDQLLYSRTIKSNRINACLDFTFTLTQYHNVQFRTCSFEFYELISWLITWSNRSSLSNRSTLIPVWSDASRLVRTCLERSRTL